MNRKPVLKPGTRVWVWWGIRHWRPGVVQSLTARGSMRISLKDGEWPSWTTRRSRIEVKIRANSTPPKYPRPHNGGWTSEIQSESSPLRKRSSRKGGGR